MPQFRPYVFGRTLEEHIDSMQHTRIWGTQVELLASASLFEMEVFVLTDSFGGSSSTLGYRWMKYSPIDCQKLSFPPADERPSALDNIHHLELFHSFSHFDCVVGVDDGTLPLATPVLSDANSSTRSPDNVVVL